MAGHGKGASAGGQCETENKSMYKSSLNTRKHPLKSFVTSFHFLSGKDC